MEWQSTPLAFIQAPPPITCPHCGATRPITVRSVDQGDGSRLRLQLCRRCSGRFRVVVEPFPPDGKFEDLDP
jgi:DNA-directed RNA polymerase subunit RPC12/RpoP